MRNAECGVRKTRRAEPQVTNSFSGVKNESVNYNKLLCHTLVVRCRLLSVSGWFWSRSVFFFNLLSLSKSGKRKKVEKKKGGIKGTAPKPTKV